MSTDATRAVLADHECHKAAHQKDSPAEGRAEGPAPKGRLTAIRDGIGAFFGAVLGLVPHVMHHIGLLAGAALVTGAGGNLLFFAIGLVFSIPLLRRLYRRFHTWRAPAIAVAVFAALFSLSAFVIGPALTGSGSDQPSTPNPVPAQNHSSHHGG